MVSQLTVYSFNRLLLKTCPVQAWDISQEVLKGGEPGFAALEGLGGQNDIWTNYEVRWVSCQGLVGLELDRS